MTEREREWDGVKSINHEIEGHSIDSCVKRIHSACNDLSLERRKESEGEREGQKGVGGGG